jgi:hypothetical protein
MWTRTLTSRLARQGDVSEVYRRSAADGERFMVEDHSRLLPNKGDDPIR